MSIQAIFYFGFDSRIQFQKYVLFFIFFSPRCKSDKQVTHYYENMPDICRCRRRRRRRRYNCRLQRLRLTLNERKLKGLFVAILREQENERGSTLEKSLFKFFLIHYTK